MCFSEKRAQKSQTLKKVTFQNLLLCFTLYIDFVTTKWFGDINIKVVIYLATQSSERIKAAILLQFTSNPLLPLPPWKIIQLSHLLISFEDKKRWKKLGVKISDIPGHDKKQGGKQMVFNCSVFKLIRYHLPPFCKTCFSTSLLSTS